MKQTLRQLKNLKNESVPDAKFRGETWLRLDLEFDQLNPKAFSWKRALAMPLAVFTIFMMTGMGTFAYANPEVTEGSRLYPIKRGIEKLEKQFYRSPTSEAQYRAKMMERRIDENEVLIIRHKISTEQAQRLQAQFREFESKNHLDQARRDQVRNKMMYLRVRIDESDLTQDQKHAILQAIILDRLNEINNQPYDAYRDIQIIR